MLTTSGLIILLSESLQLMKRHLSNSTMAVSQRMCLAALCPTLNSLVGNGAFSSPAVGGESQALDQTTSRVTNESNALPCCRQIKSHLPKLTKASPLNSGEGGYLTLSSMYLVWSAGRASNGAGGALIPVERQRIPAP